MKKITLHDFLTEAQIDEAMTLKNAKAICKQIIEPNIETINKKLGQDNDPMFLGYACEYVAGEFWKARGH